MKASQFFAITMAAFALLSCSKEEGSPSPEVGHSKLSLRIVGEKEPPKGRAAGTPTEAEESTINNFILFVFKADGTNDIAPAEYSKKGDNEIDKVVNAVITTEASEVYVIANIAAADTPETHAALMAVTKKSDLQAIIGRGFIAIAATAAPTQTSTNLWMSGQNDKPFTPVENGNVAVTVTLKYVAAKVRITTVTIDPAVTGLTPTNITVFNGAAATSLIPANGKTSLIPSYTPAVAAPFYVSGMAMTGMANKPTVSGKNNEYNYNLTGDLSIGVGKNQQYFYVFENDGEAELTDKHPTIITLTGIDAESNAVNYSVFFKADPDEKLGYDNHVIERGKSYDITMNIKKMGLNDPTIPALKTTVEVTITPAKWETVTINKVYE